VAGLMIAAVLATVAGSRSARTESPEEQVVSDIRLLRDAETVMLGLNLGGYVDLPVLAGASDYVPAKRARLDPRFLEPVRHGYRFEFRGLDPRSLSPVQPAFGAFAYAALPVSGNGRSYAFYSYRHTRVYVRDDGVLPTAADESLRLE
jgi:hypothetical protein